MFNSHFKQRLEGPRDQGASEPTKKSFHVHVHDWLHAPVGPHFVCTHTACLSSCLICLILSCPGLFTALRHFLSSLKDGQSVSKGAGTPQTNHRPRLTAPPAMHLPLPELPAPVHLLSAGLSRSVLPPRSTHPSSNAWKGPSAEALPAGQTLRPAKAQRLGKQLLSFPLWAHSPFRGKDKCREDPWSLPRHY